MSTDCPFWEAILVPKKLLFCCYLNLFGAAVKLVSQQNASQTQIDLFSFSLECLWLFFVKSYVSHDFCEPIPWHHLWEKWRAPIFGPEQLHADVLHLMAPLAIRIPMNAHSSSTVMSHSKLVTRCASSLVQSRIWSIILSVINSLNADETSHLP